MCRRALPAAAVICAVAVIAGTSLRSGNIVTLEEPAAGNATPTVQHAQAAAGEEHYAKAAPIFDTLHKTSTLAETVIAAAYRIALSEAPPPANASYVPDNQMMVIALGRLGMGEFDLGSDADINFVIPDEDAEETLFWTGVAERLDDFFNSRGGEHFTTLVFESRERAALNWHLTRREIKNMRRNLKPDSPNAKAIARLKSWWGKGY